MQYCSFIDEVRKVFNTVQYYVVQRGIVLLCFIFIIQITYLLVFLSIAVAVQLRHRAW